MRNSRIFLSKLLFWYTSSPNAEDMKLGIRNSVENLLPEFDLDVTPDHSIMLILFPNYFFLNLKSVKHWLSDRIITLKFLELFVCFLAFFELPQPLHLLSWKHKTLGYPVGQASMTETLIFSIHHASRGILKLQNRAYCDDDSVDVVVNVFLLHLLLPLWTSYTLAPPHFFFPSLEIYGKLNSMIDSR